MENKIVYVVLVWKEDEIKGACQYIYVFDKEELANEFLLELYNEVKNYYEEKGYDKCIVLPRSISYWEPVNGRSMYVASVFARELNSKK